MTRHGPALLALTVLAIAGWTYNVNYDTRAALDRIEVLRARIAEEHERLQVLRVEWAYLNAPDRLARLVSDHEERLGLVPLTPEALGVVASVPYPRDVPTQPVPAAPPEMLVASAEPAPAASMPEVAEAPEETLPLAPFAAPPGDQPAVEPGPVLAAVAEKAEAVAAARASPAPPVTMQDAVTLALIEAGVVQPGAAPEGVMSVSAGGGIPVPPARPASWASR